MTSRLIVGLIFGPVAALFAALPAAADWQAEPGDRLQIKARQALVGFSEQVPRTQPYFEQAHGFAIFPSVTRAGFGFGGAYGKGIVIEGDKAIGVTRYWQFTSGIQAGASNFTMIVFFRDAAALEAYQQSETQFMGQAGLAVGTKGLAATPAYNDGVALFTLTRLGLMGEFTVSGAKFSYKPRVGGQ